MNNIETGMDPENKNDATEKENGCAFEMEIFRTGDYGEKGKWTEADLDALAKDYDPERHEAPLTIDHAASGPAFGWVKELRRVGDRLLAFVSGVPEIIAEMIRRGNYKQRSAELVRKFRETGNPYLRAVSLLGAAIPEVKGLRPICFNAEEEVSTFDTEPDGIAALRLELLELRRKLICRDLDCAGIALSSQQKAIFCDMMDALPNGMRVVFSEGETPVTPSQWFTRLMSTLAETAAVHVAAPDTATPILEESAPEAESAEVTAFAEEMNEELDNIGLRRTAEALCRDNPNQTYAAALLQAAKMKSQI